MKLMQYVYVCSYVICNQIESAIFGIYNGGSDKDCWYLNCEPNFYNDYSCPCNNQLNVFTGNTLPSTITSSENQMFISYTNNGDGAPGKGFSAAFTFGKKVTDFSFFA